MTKIFLNTLYVGAEGAYLRLENDQVFVETPIEETMVLKDQECMKPKVSLKVPLHHLGSIVVFGRVVISTPLMLRCADDGRTVTFMTEYGRFRARVQGKTSGNVLLRKAQYQCHCDEVICLNLCKSIVAAKFQNSRQVILRSARDAKSDNSKNALVSAAQLHHDLVIRLSECNTINEVRGIEGSAAQSYFNVFDEMILAQRTEFKFESRSRRPPKDRVNCILSFLYSLWTNDCIAALEGVGLDPQFGVLHVLRPGRPSLALDLVEEFRSVFLDRLCLSLVNRKQITAQDMVKREGGSVSLTEEGRKKLLVAYQRRKQEEVRHPLLKEKVEIGLLPHIQARILARHLRGDFPEYIPYQP
jgi:CRISPR-associated protein Cas1